MKQKKEWGDAFVILLIAVDLHANVKNVPCDTVSLLIVDGIMTGSTNEQNVQSKCALVSSVVINYTGKDVFYSTPLNTMSCAKLSL